MILNGILLFDLLLHLLVTFGDVCYCFSEDVVAVSRVDIIILEENIC